MTRERWRKRLKSFGFQIAAFNMIAVLVTLLLFGGVVYAVVSDILVQESIAKTEMAIEKTATEIGADIRHAKSLLQLVTTTSAFSDFADMDSEAAAQNLMRLLKEITDSDAYVFGVFAAFADGRIVSENEKTAIDAAEYDMLLMYDMPFLTTLRSANYAHDDGCMITLGLPIAGAGGTAEGVLAMDLDYCMIGNTVSQPEIGGAVAITDSTGAVIFETGIGDTAPEDWALGYDAAQNVLVQRYAIPETDWALTGRVYLDGLAMLKARLRSIIAITGAALFIILWLIAVLHSRRLSTPVARLARSMEDIESLRELTVLADEISETQTLTQSYNRMIRKIKRLMAELEDKQRALRQTEIEALTHQINPHFLYNTLDTIVWLAEFKDNEKIIALTKSLAKFFRLSLGGGNAIVPLADELEHVRQYLYIQTERYGDKLTYTFSADDKVLDCMVPKILLQPIVENSLYHGIKPMDGIGHIAVSARQEGEALLLTVTDNGVGFAPTAKRGVGLTNVEKRIQLYYGEGAGLTIAPAPGGGTAVTLRLKMHLRKDAAG